MLLSCNKESLSFLNYKSNKVQIRKSNSWFLEHNLIMILHGKILSPGSAMMLLIIIITMCKKKNKIFLVCLCILSYPNIYLNWLRNSLFSWISCWLNYYLRYFRIVSRTVKDSTSYFLIDSRYRSDCVVQAKTTATSNSAKLVMVMLNFNNNFLASYYLSNPGNNLESKGSVWKNKKGHLEL